MSLPKISHPSYNIIIPSTKKTHKFRSFLVKEEKLLLMAKESNKPADILNAIKQVVNNCSLENLDVSKLAVFDLEYIFLKLRCYSVENIVKVSYVDNEDNKEYKFEIDLDKVEIDYPEKIDNNIKITDISGIIMKYPPASLYDDEEFLNLDKDYLFELIVRCVDKIYENDNVYLAKDYSYKELSEFLENLDSKTFNGIQNFLLQTPKLKHVMKYTNELGNERTIELSSLNDFFTLG